jgi:hypothetical protein
MTELPPVCKTLEFLVTLTPYNPRLRLAVTPEEYQQIRAYCFERRGYFIGTLYAYILVIDEHVGSPALTLEYPSERA